MVIQKKPRWKWLWILAALLFCWMLLVGGRTLARHDEDREALEAQWAGYHTNEGYSHPLFSEFVFRRFSNASLACDVEGYFVENTLYCFMPAGADSSRLVLSYSVPGGALYLDGRRVHSGFTVLNLRGEGHIFSLRGDGLPKTDFAVVLRETTLPVISIQTYDNAAIYDKSRAVPGEASLWDETGQLVRSIPAGFHTRGNITFTLPKLSYRMTSTVFTSLLGLPESDEWVLLANFMDPAGQRNLAAFDTARALGMSYVPQQRFVEVYVGGQYQGVYALTTPVGLSPASIPLSPMRRQADGGFSGSWLLEMDSSKVAEVPQSREAFITAMGIPFLVQNPYPLTADVREEIQRDIRRLETCLSSPTLSANGFWYGDLIDVDSFANAYLVQEIAKNSDAALPHSVFVYRDWQGRIAMGPLWDFDLAYGFASPEPEGFILQNTPWFAALLEDANFNAIVRENYAKIIPFLNSQPTEIAARAKELRPAMHSNFIVTYIGVNSYSNVPDDDPYDEELAYLYGWTRQRRAWLDESFG